MRTRLLAAAATLITIAALGFARSSSALSLVPPTLEFSTQAGQTVTGKIKIYNDAKDFKTYYLSTANFTAGDENGQPKFDFTAAPTDLASWMTFDTDQVNVQPGASAVVNVKITVPNNADPGGHYAGAFFSETPPDKGNVKVQQKTGSLVILTVAGAISESASVSKFSTDNGKKLTTHLPVTLDLEVRNNGNVHFRPKGFITIRNMFGGVTTTIDMNPKEGAVLPNSARIFQATWQKSQNVPKGGNFFQEVGREWTNFALGGYTAELNATYGTTNQVLTSTYHFTVMPWQLLLVIVVVLAAVVTLIVWLIGRYNRAIIKRAQANLTSGKRSSQ